MRQFETGALAVYCVDVVRGAGDGSPCSRLVKRRRALLESNPPRNNRLETHRDDGPGSRSWPVSRISRWFPSDRKISPCLRKTHVGRRIAACILGTSPCHLLELFRRPVA